MWSLSMSEAEVGSQIACKHILFLNSSEDRLIDGFLVRGSCRGWLLGLCLCQYLLLARFLGIITSGFSPCLKNASSPFSDLLFFSRTKYSGLETLSSVELSMPLRSILVDVAITYREFTRLNGTPLTLNGPVTRRAPCSRCLRRTTRLPRNRPANRISTAPGCSDSLYLVGLIDLRA